MGGSSIPSDVEENLLTSFRSAANSVTLLYRESLAQNKLSFQSGYHNCLTDLFDFVKERQETESIRGSEYGPRGPSQIHPQTPSHSHQNVHTLRHTNILVSPQNQHEPSHRGEDVIGGSPSIPLSILLHYIRLKQALISSQSSGSVLEGGLATESTPIDCVSYSRSSEGSSIRQSNTSIPPHENNLLSSSSSSSVSFPPLASFHGPDGSSIHSDSAPSPSPMSSKRR